MDIRVIKSKNSIFDAFVNLRSKKELRKITVKELCEKALINKSTFYTYYEDMFDLSDKIESSVVDGIVSTITNPQMMIDEPVKFYRSLLEAMAENKKLIDTVFSGIKDCYSSNDYVIMELLNNDTIIMVDCNNNFKYSKFDNLKSTGIDYSKFNHISIVSTD